MRVTVCRRSEFAARAVSILQQSHVSGITKKPGKKKGRLKCLSILVERHIVSFQQRVLMMGWSDANGELSFRKAPGTFACDSARHLLLLQSGVPPFRPLAFELSFGHVKEIELHLCAF